MWSFGILLWEIYSFGRVPYPRIVSLYPNLLLSKRLYYWMFNLSLVLAPCRRREACRKGLPNGKTRGLSTGDS